MSDVQHAANCNISEKLSDVCSCGADGTPTYDTFYGEKYVLGLLDRIAALEAALRTCDAAHAAWVAAGMPMEPK